MLAIIQWLTHYSLQELHSVGRQADSRLKARCPECLAGIWLKETVEMWDPVTCPECHTALEVVKLRPLTLDYLEQWADGEDEEYYEEDE
jgi:lysine biosynthesis protein LysW